MSVNARWLNQYPNKGNHDLRVTNQRAQRRRWRQRLTRLVWRRGMRR